MTDCHRARDLIIAYVTDSIADHQLRELLDHVAACDGCSAYLRDMARAMEGLPYTLPLVKPPTGLRERVLDRIAREAGAGRPGDEQGNPAPQDTPDDRPSGEPGQCKSALSNRWRWVAAVAAALLVGAQLHLIRQVGSDRDLLRDELTQARREIAAAATVLGEGVIEPQWVVRMEKGDGFERAWGHATLYRTRYGDVLVLAVGGLPRPEGGGTYRAWLWGEDGATPAGPLEPDAAGYASLIVQLKRFDHRTMAITWEADGHAEGPPRGPRVLTAATPEDPPPEESG